MQYVNQSLQIQLELLMMSDVLLETCWAFNERWNNKFCYKVASCWLFLLNHNIHGRGNGAPAHACDHVWSVITRKRRHHSCEKYMFSEIRDHKYHKYLSLHKHVDWTYHAPDLPDAWPLALSHRGREMREKRRMESRATIQSCNLCHSLGSTICKDKQVGE